jgi:hypothetical protein
MTNYELARQWMIDNAADYDDGIDINTTRLAEDAAEQFDIYNDDIDFPIPEWVYKLAVEVEAWYLSDGTWTTVPDMLDGESEDW